MAPPPSCVMGLGAATKASPFTCPLCAENGDNVQTSARSVCLLFKKFGATSYCSGLVLFPATRFVTGSLLKIPFNSDVLLTQQHPGKITFCILEKASRLFDCP